MTAVINKVIPDAGSKTYITEVVALSGGGATLTIEMDPAYRHSFVGMVYYNSIDGKVPVQPTEGSSDTTIKTVSQPQGYQDVPNKTLDASKVDQSDWSANVKEVKVVITGIVGATHVRAIATSNVS